MNRPMLTMIRLICTSYKKLIALAKNFNPLQNRYFLILLLLLTLIGFILYCLNTALAIGAASGTTLGLDAIADEEAGGVDMHQVTGNGSIYFRTARSPESQIEYRITNIGPDSPEADLVKNSSRFCQPRRLARLLD